MSALNLRLTAPLKSEAAAYAKRIGVSLNALVAVAVRDYLDHRSLLPVAAPPAPSPAQKPEPAVRVATGGGTTIGAVRAASTGLQPAAVSKAGRNDPCPCGSGKKYKQCHGGAL